MYRVWLTALALALTLAGCQQLPPSPEEVDAFVADLDPQAHEILTGLARQGFRPYSVMQGGSRDEEKRGQRR